jgi:diguanylate cyclase (GGDEF)-like protein/PAS domain S-box-containing protein
MKWLNHPGIRTRLLLLVLMLAVPFLVYVGVSARRQAEVDREDGSQRMLAAARVTAARLDDHIGDIEQLIKVVAHVVGTRDTDLASNDELFAAMIPSLPPHVNNVSVWTTQGVNVGTTHPEVRDKRGNLAASPVFKEAIASDGIVVNAPFKSRINDEQIGVLAMAVRRNGVVVGVVTVSTRLRRLEELLAPKETLPEGSVITVSDEHGKLLARSLDPDRFIGVDVSRQGYFEQALATGDGTAEGPGADGVVRIAGFTTARRVPWLVYVAAPSASVLTDVRRRTHQTLWFGAAMLLVGLGLAFWVGELISRPLRRLSADAARLGSGDLSHRSSVPQGGEIGVLAETLNRMAQTLQERSVSLQQSQEQLRQVTDNVPALVAYFDRDLRFRFANRAYADWLGTDPSSLIGRSLSEVYGESTYAGFARHMERALEGERIVYERDMDTRHGPVHVQSTVVPHTAADEKVEGLYVLTYDVTERKRNEERLRQLAEFDLLTGLPNRGLFLDRLHQAMVRSTRTDKPMALLFLDVDHFKQVNDQHGHAAGDEVLRTFARRLAQAVRSSDTVARMSGDEFTVILHELAGMDDARRLAEKVVLAMREPMEVLGVTMHLTTSVGVALSRPSSFDGPELIKRADTALYGAKRNDRNGCFCEGDDDAHRMVG